jgi:hypothetical protein
MPHKDAAGSTVSMLPMASSRSQPAAAAAARSKTPGGSGWPNMAVADLSMPPQRVHGGSASPARTLVRASRVDCLLRPVRCRPGMAVAVQPGETDFGAVSLVALGYRQMTNTSRMT